MPWIMGRMTSTAQFIEAHRNSDDAALAAALVKHAGQLALGMREEGLTTDYKTCLLYTSPSPRDS